MSSISNVNNDLIQSQLAGAQLRQDISVKVAVKARDAAKMEGAMALKLLDAAADVAHSNGDSAVTIGQLITGLGRNLDVTA